MDFCDKVCGFFSFFLIRALLSKIGRTALSTTLNPTQHYKEVFLMTCVTFHKALAV